MIKEVYLDSYISEQTQTKSPFADTATLVGDIGLFPKNVIIDIFLYLLDKKGPAYLSKIDLDNKIIEFTDSENNIVGVSRYANGDYTVYEEFPEYEFKRPVGKVVINEAHDTVGTYTFNNTAEISQHNYVILHQGGITGLVINKKVYTGHVKFRGINGIYIYSYYKDGVPYLEFDCVGAISDNNKAYKDCGESVIKQVCFETKPTSGLYFVDDANNPNIIYVGHRHKLPIAATTLVEDSTTSGGYTTVHVDKTDGLYDAFKDKLDEDLTQDYIYLAHIGAYTYQIIRVTESGNKLAFIFNDTFTAQEGDAICIVEEVNTTIEDICVTGNRVLRFIKDNKIEDPCKPMELIKCESAFSTIPEKCIWPEDKSLHIIPLNIDARPIIDIDSKEVTEQRIINKYDNSSDVVTDTLGELTFKIVGANSE